MNTQKNSIFTLIILMIAAFSNAQYIDVDDTYTAQQLVENVLVNSPCATVSNITVSGDDFSGLEKSYGYFSSGTSTFPFADGVVLSTARARRSEGPNVDLIDEGSPGWLGDNDLQQALNVAKTVNATILEFDFTPLTSKVSFEYLFASEEYHDTATCNYSDGFAFLLKVAGSSDPYQNLALIPNTNIPVKVTSVHPTIPEGCPAQNEEYFGSFNDGVSSPTNFNGQTIPLIAKANVVPGLTYHIKLVIADEQNYRYDSAIFLSGGSFKVGTDLGSDQLFSTSNPVCAGETFPLVAKEPNATAYKWFRNNVLLVGENSSLYTVTSAGDYKVEVTLGSSTCNSIGEIKIEYSNLPVLSNTTLVQCDLSNTGSAAFNLTNSESIIKNNDTTLGVAVFYENNIDAQSGNNNFILNPLNYTSIPKTIYARIPNAFSCYSVASVQLQLTSNTITNTAVLEICDLDNDPIQDGFYHLTLSDANAQVLLNLPSGLVVEYYETINEALLHPEKVLDDDYYNIVANNQIIYAKIVNGPDCYGVIPVQLIIHTFDPLGFEDEEVTVCPGDSKTLSVAPNFEKYLWSNGDEDEMTEVSSAGVYTVTVFENGCSKTKSFTVVSPAPPKITSVDVTDLSSANNTVLINFVGEGTYEFSLDGITFQDSQFFDNVKPGNYNVIINDINGCGADSSAITVLNYPRYFTPNDDGYNDLWTIESLQSQKGIIITIFDRYGKLLKQFSSTSVGWNGKYNSVDLPSDDYWFILDFESGRTVKGHFALKR